MDNLCHTLTGAALAQAGLKRRTALGAATLIIAANLPDVDILSYFRGETFALGFRRGWTHGILALLAWPWILAGVMLAFDRIVTRRGARFQPLLLLAAVGILSHPLLDSLNTYGVRWLMPFSDRWFYGDTLFIVDVWVWLLLTAGLVWSTRRERKGHTDWTRPATAALLAGTVYVAVMATVGRLAESQVRFELRGQGSSPREVLASPLPVTPLEREIVVAEPEGFRIGAIRLGGSFEEQGRWPRLGDGGPVVDASAAMRDARTFLAWARYPTFLVDRRGGVTIVHFIDLRYARAPGSGFGTLAVPMTVGQVARTEAGEPMDSTRLD